MIAQAGWLRSVMRSWILDLEAHAELILTFSWFSEDFEECWEEFDYEVLMSKLVRRVSSLPHQQQRDFTGLTSAFLLLVLLVNLCSGLVFSLIMWSIYSSWNPVRNIRVTLHTIIFCQYNRIRIIWELVLSQKKQLKIPRSQSDLVVQVFGQTVHEAEPRFRILCFLYMLKGMKYKRNCKFCLLLVLFSFFFCKLEWWTL